MKKNYNNDLYSISFKMKKELQKRILMTIVNVFLIFVVINSVISFVVFPVCERSSSMHPDVPKNSLVLVTPLIKNPERGEIFFLNKREGQFNVFLKLRKSFEQFFTLQKLNFETSYENLSTSMSLRRVVGLPGDTLYMKDFIIYIKPQGEKHFLTEFELADKTYNIDIKKLPEGWDESIGLKSEFSPVVLGPGQYLVLADNRSSSMDSRFWGVINKSEFIGKALVVYFPFTKFKLF